MALLLGGATVAYLNRDRVTVIPAEDLSRDWERLHEADKKLQDKMSPSDYLDSGLDGLR